MIWRLAFHCACILLGIDQPQTETTPAERDPLASFLPGAKHIDKVGLFKGFTIRVLPIGPSGPTRRYHRAARHFADSRDVARLYASQQRISPRPHPTRCPLRYT